MGSKTSYPVAGSTIWSLSWSPQLLAPGHESPRPPASLQWWALRPLVGTHAHTQGSPPVISLRHWLYPAAGPRIPWSPTHLTDRCKSFSGSWSRLTSSWFPDLRVAGLDLLGADSQTGVSSIWPYLQPCQLMALKSLALLTHQLLWLDFC